MRENHRLNLSLIGRIYWERIHETGIVDALLLMDPFRKRIWELFFYHITVRATKYWYYPYRRQYPEYNTAYQNAEHVW